MHVRPRSVERLIEAFSRLPSIGAKTAERLAYHLLRSDPRVARELSDAYDGAAVMLLFCRLVSAATKPPPC